MWPHTISFWQAEILEILIIMVNIITSCECTFNWAFLQSITIVLKYDRFLRLRHFCQFVAQSNQRRLLICSLVLESIYVQSACRCCNPSKGVNLTPLGSRCILTDSLLESIWPRLRYCFLFASSWRHEDKMDWWNLTV